MAVEYARFRRTELAGRPRCEVSVSGCLGRATEIHHILTRSRGGRKDSDLLDPANVLTVCRRCHEFVHQHPAESAERGWLRHGWD